MTKPLGHKSVTSSVTPRDPAISRAYNRRQFLKLGTAGMVLLGALQGGIITSIVSAPKSAIAQPSVKNLKPFPLKKLKELDSQMDGKYKREFWETKDGYFVTAKVTGENGNYVRVIASTNSTTIEKGITIQFPKDLSKPDGEVASVEINLQRLYDYYEVACIDAGRKPKENPWVKIMFEVDARGVTIFTTFVDERPKPNDGSDLKIGYPMLVRVYMRESNGVSTSEWYMRLNGEEKIAQRPTR